MEVTRACIWAREREGDVDMSVCVLCVVCGLKGGRMCGSSEGRREGKVGQGRRAREQGRGGREGEIWVGQRTGAYDVHSQGGR